MPQPKARPLRRYELMRSIFAQLPLSAVLLLTLPAAAVNSADAVMEKTREDGQVQRVFREWLTAFNSGASESIKAFYGKYLDDSNPMFALESAQDTCGFDVERVEASSTTTMTVLLAQRCLPGLQRAKIELATNGTTLKTLDFRPLALPRDAAVKVTATIAGRLAARNDFAGAIVIARAGKKVLADSWGVATPATQTPITLDTPMFLASAGKMFTAVSVLQLVDAGKIDLDAPLGEYLTDYPNAQMAKVTIRQLLTHRGGTGDIGILGRDEGANRQRVRTIADIVRLNGNRGPDFPPGTNDDYSNYGFILLGAVIEKVTDGSYYDYVAQHVFRPAGMAKSGFPNRDQLQGVAVGYTTFFGAEPNLVANTDVLPGKAHRQEAVSPQQMTCCASSMR